MGVFFQDLKFLCKKSKGKVAFPEIIDRRILQAINDMLREDTLDELVVLPPTGELLKLARDAACDDILAKKDKLFSIQEEQPDFEGQVFAFLKKNLKDKPWTEEALNELAANPLYQAGYLLAKGRVDCVLAGAIHASPDVIRAALRTIGKAQGVRAVSGSFLLERDEKVLLFADCGVNVDPSEDDLVTIASESVKLWQHMPPLARQEPKVAFLSFSTKGSAKHAHANKMIAATKKFQALYPDIPADGELQFDAAFDREIGERKAPGSAVVGSANIFIFPDLDAGNIAYKITQRLAGFAAYGPILQGLRLPYSDLSRGATVHDIVACTYINLLRARSFLQATSLRNA
ncbi:MAG: phosphate acetyltransferase [Deltaproteobacteria bacterium]|nr:phosphate acetyltransferase [Deltaproteobacteria bacterium]